MASSLSSSEQLSDVPKTKKRFSVFPRRKHSTHQKNTSANTRKGKKSTKSASAELVDRAKFDSEDYTTSKSDSQRNLIAMAYKAKGLNSSLTNSLKDSSKAPKSKMKTESSEKRSIFTGSSFFRKLCDDVFNSIDVDKSGKINESELYQGLLLIHLKLGLYFGPAACKPISLERTKFIFNKLDTNRDGSLDKEEFGKVLALLMGNVVSRILFQFVCTLLIVPFVANTILEKMHGGYGILTESLLPVFREKYLPLLEVALGVDLIFGFVSATFATVNDVIQKTGITELMFNVTEEPAEFIAEKFDAFVLQPISEIPQETWDSIPLTMVSTALALMIVPYSLVKTDDFFRFIANKSG